jgi:hypothetical protein
MANADYQTVATGNFSQIARVTSFISRTATSISITDVRDIEGDGPAQGDLVLLNDEFMQITSVGVTSWGVKRGCLDTIPQEHAIGSNAFIVRTGSIGTDRREYLGTETISLKVLPKTPGGATPIEYAPPNQLTFGQRFARPYPPAQVKANYNHWGLPTIISSSVPLILTWVDRNRVLQADSVLGHNDAGVTPEDGVEYVIRLYTAGGTLVKTVTVINENRWTYSWQEMGTDFNLGAIGGGGIYEAYLTLHAKRDGFESRQFYRVNFARYLNEIPNVDSTPSVLLIRFTGNEGSTSATDESGQSTPIQFVGDAKITKQVASFQNGSLVIPNPASFVRLGNVGQVPANIYNALQSNSWTIEGFATVDAPDAGGVLFSVELDPVVGPPDFAIYVNIQTGNILMYRAGSLFLPNTTTRDRAPAPGQRFHWAVVCESISPGVNKMRWFINGQSMMTRRDGLTYFDWDYWSNSAPSIGHVRIGRASNGTWANGSFSAIGSIKISNTAKYTGPYTAINSGGTSFVFPADFTPPSDFAPNTPSIPNVDTTPSVLLLRFQGTEGSTATVDESGNSIPVAFFNNAIVTRTLPVFPNGSLVLPSPPPPSPKSYLKIGSGSQVPSQISSAFASGSWTIEGFASVGSSENTYMTVFALQDLSGGVTGKPEFAIAVGAQNSNPNIVIYFYGSLYLPRTVTRLPAPNRNKRFHWAVVCDEGKMRWFIDGKSLIARLDGLNAYDWDYMGAPGLTTGELLIGASATGIWSETSQSGIGAVKISNSAKYTGSYVKINPDGQTYTYNADFTPPDDFAPAP